MKMIKGSVLFCSILLAMMAFVDRAAGQTAYAVLQDGTLTFYYDKNKTDDALPIQSSWDDPNWTDEIRQSVAKAVFDKSFAKYRPTSCAYWFYNLWNLTEISDMKEYLKTENVTSMGDMFAYCSSLVSIDVSNFNTENVTDISWMFRGCSSLASLDLSNFNTGKVTSMGGLFHYCSSLTTLDLSNFNTENVWGMFSMFDGCSNLQTIYVGDNWTTENVRSGGDIFDGCRKLYGGKGSNIGLYDENDYIYARIDGGKDAPGFFTKSGDEPFAGPYAYALLDDEGTLTFFYDKTMPEDAIDIPSVTDKWHQNWKSEVKKAIFDKSFRNYRPTKCCNWFDGCSKMTEIIGMKANLNTSNITDMSDMFSGCRSLTTIDLSGFNTYNVQTMSGMFRWCNTLTNLDLSSFNTSNVKDMKWLFQGCSKLITIYVSDKWTTENVSYANNIFDDCNKLYGGEGSCLSIYGGTDCSYARIDGGKDAPGYFTRSGDAPYEGDEAYAVLDNNGTLTFYYDKRIIEGAIDIAGDHLGWNNWSSNVTKVVFDKTFKKYRPTTCQYWFYRCNNLTEIIGMKEYLNTSLVENMSRMFEGCSSLTAINLSGFNTENVKDMDEMFEGCSSLTSLDLSSFNTENVERIGRMFYGCRKLKTIYIGDNWTTKNVYIDYGVFEYCNKLYGGLGASIGTYGVTDGTYARIDGGDEAPGYFTKVGEEPFVGPEAYAILDDEGTLTLCYDTMMPEIAIDIASGELGRNDWKSNVKKVVFDQSFKGYRPMTCSYWFYDCSNLTEIIGMKEYLNTDNVTDLSMMFAYCSSLKCLDLSNFNTVNVTGMYYMFHGCNSLTSLDLSSFNTENVTDMHSMFEDCYNLKTIYVGDNWTTENAFYTNCIFDGCKKLYGGQGSCIRTYGTDASFARIDGGEDAPGYFTKSGDEPFGGPYAYVLLDDEGTLTFYYDKNLDEKAYSIFEIQDWCGWKSSVKKVIFDKSFKDYRPTSCRRWFDGCYNMTEIIGMRANLNTNNVTDMSEMFNGCSSLLSLDLSNFNTENVTDMSEMFDGCSSLISLDLSNFNTEKVTSMYCMFNRCSSLITLDLSNFNTEKVSTMDCMFDGCGSLTTLDLSGFNTENVTEMSWMFGSCHNLRTIYVGANWTTKNVYVYDNDFYHPDAMFFGCDRLYGGLGSCISDGGTGIKCARIDGGVDAPGYFTKSGEPAWKASYAYVVLDDDGTLTFYFDDNPPTNAIDIPFSIFSDDEGWKSDVKKVVFDKSFKDYSPTVCNGWFKDCINLTEIVGMKENLNTCNVTQMVWMFSNCSNLTSLDVSSFNTENVTDMWMMFSGCCSLKSLDISNFNTENVTTMNKMFFGCSNLQNIYVGDKWNTNSVTESDEMFSDCISLVGGNGTMYSENFTDATYARIDDPENSKSGYLTDVGGMQNVVPVSIFVSIFPSQIEYLEGEKLNLEGGQLTINFADESTEIIGLDDEKVSISGYDANKTGEQTIIAEYEGAKCAFNVTVVDKIPVSIRIVKLPNTTEYTEGDDFYVKGGKFEVVYNNNTSEIFDLEVAEIIGYDKNKVGKQTVTVRYENLTTTIDVTVEEDIESPVSELDGNLTTKIWSFDNTIVIENGGWFVKVIDLSGRVIKDIKSDNDRVEIPIANAGIYIVKTATKSQKVIIR